MRAGPANGSLAGGPVALASLGEAPRSSINVEPAEHAADDVADRVEAGLRLDCGAVLFWRPACSGVEVRAGDGRSPGVGPVFCLVGLRCRWPAVMVRAWGNLRS